MDEPKEKSLPKNRVMKAAENTTRWIGSPTSIIIHTIFFAVIFALRFFGISLEDVLLFLTTIVSLEAIYLAIFIQMTVNKQAEKLMEVHSDVEELNEDVDELAEDIGEISEDIDEISEDIDDIQKEQTEKEQ